jgi:hypothetical protein
VLRTESSEMVALASRKWLPGQGGDTSRVTARQEARTAQGETRAVRSRAACACYIPLSNDVKTRPLTVSVWICSDGRSAKPRDAHQSRAC